MGSRHGQQPGQRPGGFPAAVSFCISGINVVDATTLQVTDACAGLLIELKRQPK